MKKQQWIVVASGLVLLLSLYFLGRTKPHASKTPAAQAAADHKEEQLESASILETAKSRLSPERQAWLTAKENSVVRGDVAGQKIKLYDELAAFWKDSAHVFEPFMYYLGEKSKLENSEKSLTFAAHLYLKQLKGVEQHALQVWMANQAADLFKQALTLNPGNDSSKIGLGSSYIFGASGASSPMEGIQRLLEVVRRDSTNMYAQFMLGYGGIMTGQFDKAIERLNLVVRAEPDNTEAVFLLAEAYERHGENAKAVQWYEEGKKFVQNPEALKEIDKRIKALK
ncbi:tetratricopeptide repeat protein [Agriterribacter sp.]|uniref:tetratricopeptide repeat protein n=1 Tax=Agriterribacter sp. TaxID=2821509 RepID=UPI002C1888D5|nr:tetratricopeptide repeat protein [Agriterribacter sp.]HRP54680.1 tetratricopeptide repeat protein [Agriterribacter sp.]